MANDIVLDAVAVMRQALTFIVSAKSKGQRRQTAKQALADVFAMLGAPTGEVAEAVSTGLDVQFDAGYKKGYADAKQKIAEIVAAKIAEAQGTEQGAVSTEPPASGGGVWLAPIAFDPAKSLAKQVKEAMAPTYGVYDDLQALLPLQMPAGECDCSQCQTEAAMEQEFGDEEPDDDIPF